MQRFVLRSWLAALALTLACAPLASATSIVPPEFDSLVDQADYIVRATVKSVTAEWRDNPDAPGTRYIATRVELAVAEVIAGSPPTPLVLDLVGGRIGQEELLIDGSPKFKVGEESILFVRGNGRQITPLVAMAHGYYPIRRDARTGEVQVLRGDGRPLYREADVALPLGAVSEVARTNASARPLTATGFATSIRQTVTLNAEKRARAR